MATSIGCLVAGLEAELMEAAPTKAGSVLEEGSIVEIVKQTGDTTIVEWNAGQYEIDDSTRVTKYVATLESVIFAT